MDIMQNVSMGTKVLKFTKKRCENVYGNSHFKDMFELNHAFNIKYEITLRLVRASRRNIMISC